MADNDASLMRKISPAYNAVDIGDFKACIRLCEKNDIKNEPLARALKAYAMERKASHEVAAALKATGPGTNAVAKRPLSFTASCDRDARFKESLDLAMEVASTNPNSIRVTHLLMLVFRNAGAWEELVDMYVGLNKRQPGVAEHAESLFFWQLRLGNLDEMEKQGMGLSRSLSNEQYLGWSAAMLICNAKRIASDTYGLGDEVKTAAKEKAGKKLALAEMMLRKLVKAHPAKSREKGAVPANGGVNNYNEDDEYDIPEADAATTADVFANNLRALLLQALVLQGKTGDAVTFAEQELEHLQAHERLLYLAETQQLNGENASAAEIFFELLSKHDSEDWRNWCGWLESSFAAAGGDESKESAMLAAVETIAEPKLRGPNLALVHYNFRRLLRTKHSSCCGQDTAALENRLVGSVQAYLRLFDCKACCFGDLRNILLGLVTPWDKDSEDLCATFKSLSSLPKPPAACAVYFSTPILEMTMFEEQRAKKRSRRWPVEEFVALVGSDSTALQTLLCFLQERLDSASNELAALGAMTAEAYAADLKHKADGLKAVRTAITAYQVSRFLGKWESLDYVATLKLVKNISELYNSTLWLDEGATGGEREVKVGDDLALLASHVLVDLCNREPSSSSLVNVCLFAAAAILEKAYEHSPAGFQLGLGLMEIYARLDMVPKVCELYTRLDIKHVQLDSLTHLVLGDAAACGMWSEAARCCSNMEFFWKSSRTDNVNYAKRAFKLCNLGHGLEFLRLDRLVQRSHARATGVAEGATFAVLSDRLDAWDGLKQALLADGTPHTQGKYRQRTRLADLPDHTFLPKALASNYDFGARMSWDYPLGCTARAERARLERGSGVWGQMSQHRSNQGSSSYDEAWHARALQWLRLRKATSRLFRVALDSGAAQEVLKPFESNASFATDLRAQLETLGFFHASNGESTHELFWESAWLAVEATLALVEADGNRDDLVKTQPAIDKMAQLVPALDKARNHMQQESYLGVREVAALLSHQLLWLAVLVRCWMDMVPRKKNKKKKANPTSAEQVLEALQSAIKAASVAFINAADGLAADLKKPPAEIVQGADDFAFLEPDRVNTIHKAYVANCELINQKLITTVEGFRGIVKNAKY